MSDMNDSSRQPVKDGPGAVFLDGVTKRFGSLTAVDGVRLNVQQGEFLTLLGPSGCGKTTLLNLIAGFLEADEGDVFIHGRCVTHTPVYKRSIGMVFQSYALFPHMTVADNVAFGLKMRKTPRSEIGEKVRAALDIVRLGGLADRRPRQLSGGQQQRVALARALVIDPGVLLLDEPLSALDKNLRAEMQVELKQIQRRIGVTTIFVTHDQGEALSLSDRIAVMGRGIIQQISSPSELYTRPTNSFVASFIGDVNKIPGRISATGDIGIEVKLPADDRIVLPHASSGQVGVGDGVQVFVRPERLHLDPEAGDPVIARGTVEGHVYQGAYADIYVSCTDIGILHTRTTDMTSFGRWPIGSTVEIAANLQDALLFPS